MLRMSRLARAARSSGMIPVAPWPSLVWVALTACALTACGAEITSSGDAPPLAASNGPEAVTLSGPDEVRVERLGPVEGPRVVTADGLEVPGVRWSASPEEVAHVADGLLVARAAGRATVTARVHEQTLSWTLVVDPATGLQFVEPPSTLRVGDAVQLRLAPRGEPGAVDDIDWATSDDAVLEVASGRATAVGPGTAWITAKARSGSRAILQLQVAPPDDEPAPERSLP